MNTEALRAALGPVLDEVAALERRVDTISEGHIPEVLIRRIEGGKAMLRSWAADFTHRRPVQLSKGALPDHLKSTTSEGPRDGD